MQENSKVVLGFQLFGDMKTWARWLIAVAVCGWGAAGLAQDYPTRPVRLIVPFPPGAGADVVGRMIAQKLTDSFGRQVVVDNRPGAGGTLGAAIAARSAPDGYTLMMGSIASLGSSKGLYKNLPYDPVRDFTPVTLVARAPSGFLVHPGLPARSVKDVIALAKAKPGQYNYSSSGGGSPSHLAMELFKSMAGVNVMHVPYRGPAEALTALATGQVHVEIQSLLSATPFIRGNRVRLLATTGAKREPEYPAVPTVAEVALPGFEAYTWFGVVTPAGAPDQVLRRLHSEVVRALDELDVRKYFASQGAEVVGNKPEEFAAFIKTEVAKWTKVIKDSGAQVE